MKSGCLGSSYNISKIYKNDLSYLVFSRDNINIFVIHKFIQFIDGIKIDYIKEGLNRRFTFEHPKIVRSCKCGESFVFI
ncbi:hypothetical protein AOQ87_02035 [Candidatus Riesia pediculischaeffi]|uniref:FeS cluster biogenesis domain-containing protein n=1 Tax=Candidatus Riesia pediculischaeffi TaxID=428411 RepID=A0A1V0HKT3_9ENTR|nr:hypothetical protein AOQ87_02035 [Candidatus Riesia pediculischaeffi]